MSTDDPDKITDFSSTADYGVAIDLTKIATQFRNSELKPEFVEIKFENPKGTAQLFKDGKAVFNEYENELDSILLVKRLGSMLKKIGYDVHINAFSIKS